MELAKNATIVSSFLTNNSAKKKLAGTEQGRHLSVPTAESVITVSQGGKVVRVGVRVQARQGQSSHRSAAWHGVRA